VGVSVWVFVWLMVVLKIPILGLYLLVRWAVRQTPEPELGGAQGGAGTRAVPRPVHPRPPLPRRPRRGPHGGAASVAPARVRPASAHAKRRRRTIAVAKAPGAS
jgi:hypothetical protein